MRRKVIAVMMAVLLAGTAACGNKTETGEQNIPTTSVVVEQTEESAAGTIKADMLPSAAVTGISHQNVAPLSGLLQTPILPPCISTRILEYDRPIPLPYCSLVL